MNHYRRLSHTSWDRKYHLVWIPKCRKKVLSKDLRKYLGDKYIKIQEEADKRIDQPKLC